MPEGQAEGQSETQAEEEGRDSQGVKEEDTELPEESQSGPKPLSLSPTAPPLPSPLPRRSLAWSSSTVLVPQSLTSSPALPTPTTTPGVHSDETSWDEGEKSLLLSTPPPSPPSSLFLPEYQPSETSQTGTATPQLKGSFLISTASSFETLHVTGPDTITTPR